MRQYFALLFFAFATCLISYNGLGQTSRGLWTGAEIDQPFTKSLTVSLAPEFRLTSSPFMLDAFLFEVDVKYKIISLVQFEGSYRYSRFHDDPDDYYNGHRFALAFKSKFDLGRFKFSYRAQFQHDMINWYSYGYSIENKENVRNRLQISYNIPKTKLEPFIMAEIFYDISSDKQHEFNRVRLRAGFSYPLNKRSDIQIYGQYQDKLNTGNPLTSYIIGVYYIHRFKKLKSDKPMEANEE